MLMPEFSAFGERHGVFGVSDLSAITAVSLLARLKAIEVSHQPRRVLGNGGLRPRLVQREQR